jgi:hypothetical protein
MQNNSENPVDLLLSLLSTGKITDSAPYYQQILQNADQSKPSLVQQFCDIEDEARHQVFIPNLRAQLIVLSDYLFGTFGQKTKKLRNKFGWNEGSKGSYRIVDNLTVFI